MRENTVESRDLRKHLVAAMAFMAGAALMAFGAPWLFGWTTVSPVLCMSAAVFWYMWRDVGEFVMDSNKTGTERHRAVVRVIIAATFTAALLIAAYMEDWRTWATSASLVLGGVFYRMICARFGTLAMEDAKLNREEEQRRLDEERNVSA